MEHASKPRMLVHKTVMPIRWGDMDAYRHVNNIIYFQYMEQARAEYLASIGYPIVPKGTAPVIINASCTFLIPLTYPGTVELTMFLSALGRSSLMSSYEIRVQGDDALYATGAAKIVWTDVTTGKSVMIPEDLRKRLSEIAG